MKTEIIDVKQGTRTYKISIPVIDDSAPHHEELKKAMWTFINSNRPLKDKQDYAEQLANMVYGPDLEEATICTRLTHSKKSTSGRATVTVMTSDFTVLETRASASGGGYDKQSMAVYLAIGKDIAIKAMFSKLILQNLDKFKDHSQYCVDINCLDDPSKLLNKNKSILLPELSLGAAGLSVLDKFMRTVGFVPICNISNYETDTDTVTYVRKVKGN